MAKKPKGGLTTWVVRSGSGLAAIAELPPPMTAEDVLRVVSGYATGCLGVPEKRLAAVYKLGEAYKLWGAGSKGVQAQKPAASPSFDVTDTPQT